MIKVTVNQKQYKFDHPLTLEQVVEQVQPPNQERIVAAVVNNRVYDLSCLVDRNCQLKFLRRGGVLGNRIYRRSLFLVMARAIYEIFPEGRLSIEHSLSNGIYCEIHKQPELNQNDIQLLKQKMEALIAADLPIKRVELTRDQALDIFKQKGFTDKVKFLEQLSVDNYPLYELDDYYDYFYYHLVPATGYLKKFDLHYRYPGFVLLYPQKKDPDTVPGFIDQPKLANVFMEYEQLGEILGVGTSRELNNFIRDGEYGELIRIAEGLHEKDIAQIADKIASNIESKRIILIAGPSSSGKTTFSRRLSTQLRINGLNPVAISLDDYFVNREDTPLDDDGNYDFEALEAIDLNLFNRHLVQLLQGEEVEIPSFNFQTGKREYRGKVLELEEDQPILIEGIHGLNDRLTRVIPQDHKFKIYVSALTQINIDRHNRIPTTDTRIIRRIIRDHHFRGHSASKTINIWPSVRNGEERNIFPFQENADVMFNSALIYEMAVLKQYAMPLLEKIDESQTSFYEARRLIEVLNCFETIPPDDIPKTSIIREFIGGSAFRD